jgi:hypothetical protein
MFCSLVSVRGETTTTELKIRTAASEAEQPPRAAPVESKSATQLKLVAPIRPAQLPSRTRLAARQTNFQIPPEGTAPITPAQPAQPALPLPNQSAPPQAAPPQPASAPQDPCAGMKQTPLGELGIDIGPTEGLLPTNHAEVCWRPVNEAAGPLAGARLWSPSQYFWDATCLCYRPLYFEEVNLERYGYGCHPCLQAGASAAHFFGTVAALPYCMAVDCPCQCVYALGHYRPGSCPPWRHHWPPYKPTAAASEAGVLAGLILVFP